MNIDAPNQPTHLYKYRDDSQRTEDIIKTQKIWLSTPAQLNDPLECRIGEIPKEWELKTIRQMEEGQLLGIFGRMPFEVPKRLFSLSEKETKNWLKRFNKISHKQRVAAMRDLYSQHGIELSRPADIFRDMRQRLAAVGVFSLSETCENELMWAHYGANHEGIAIGFSRTLDCKLGDSRHTFPATYTAEKPNFNAGFKNEVQIFVPGSGVRNRMRVSFEDDVFRSAIRTKTPAWEYEREWRYVEETHGLFDLPGEITAIVFGLRMKSNRREQYKRLVKQFIENEVIFFEVREKASLSGLEIKQL